MTREIWISVIAAFTLALPPTAAHSQGLPSTAPTEKVIVTAPRVTPDAAVNDFVRSYTSPSVVTGKIVRWGTGICPLTAGQPSGINQYVTKRIRQVATMVGAPVRKQQDCRPNVNVMFTTHPQALLDEIRTKHPVLLGYHGNNDLERIATVSHPIQAWYTTETVDMYGGRSIDNVTRSPGVWIGPFYFPYARLEQVEGTSLRDGLHGELNHVVIVVDVTKLGNHEIGPVADFIAMLALAQTQAFDACEKLSSIVNLMTPGCDPDVRSNVITDGDFAYLRAVYSMNSDLLPEVQKIDIANRMKDGLAGH